MKPHPIDIFFNKNLAGISRDPSPQTWEKLSVALENKASYKSKNRTWLLWLGVIAFLSTSLIFIIFNDESKAEKNSMDPISEKNQKKTEMPLEIQQADTLSKKQEETAKVIAKPSTNSKVISSPYAIQNNKSVVEKEDIIAIEEEVVTVAPHPDEIREKKPAEEETPITQKIKVRLKLSKSSLTDWTPEEAEAESHTNFSFKKTITDIIKIKNGEKSIPTIHFKKKYKNN